MLFMVGGVQVTHSGFNVDAVERAGEAVFATYHVVGAEPQYEFMGEGERTIALSGKIHPIALGGGSSLSALEAMRQAGKPTMLVRGDGGFHAWVIIDKISEKHHWLNSFGQPQVVEHEISMKRCDSPQAAGLGALLSIF